MKVQLCSCLLYEEAINRSEANLCWLSTSLVLLAPFVWLMSECDTLPIVPLSEPHTLSSPPLSNSHEIDELSEPASPELNELIPEGNPGCMKGCGQ